MIDAADPMAKWTPAPEWRGAKLTRPRWFAMPLLDLSQWLLTGNLDVARASFSPRPDCVGLWALASGTRDAIRIGRDRALLVSAEPVLLATGWRPEGWAASDASDAYGVLRLGGADLGDVVAEATNADVGAGSPSAAILFAGVPALLYRVSEGEARLHVEAPWLAYVWRWLETR